MGEQLSVTVSSFDPGWVRTAAQELFQTATAQVDSGYFWKGGQKRAWCSGSSIRAIQSLLGHADVRTTMIYTSCVPSKTIKELRSPLDF